MVRIALCAAAVALAADHPVLPTMWTATVNELQVGVVQESETFVAHGATSEKPSAKWTNFTDGSCQRLILKNGNLEESGRYLLGCDAVACCYEDDGGEGPMEYQIPNVHPAWITTVKSGGKQTITTFSGTELEETVEADVWNWTFAGVQQFSVHTTPTQDAGVAQLHKWTVKMGDEYPNEYKNFRAIPEEEQESFLKQFQIPQVCQGNIVSCNDARKSGKLSERSYKFVKNGQTLQQQMFQAATAV